MTWIAPVISIAPVSFCSLTGWWIFPVNRKKTRPNGWRIVDQVLPRFEKAGYTIHTIALSDNADTELLNKLALSTDGIAAVAKSADDLMKIFLKAF